MTLYDGAGTAIGVGLLADAPGAFLPAGAGTAAGLGSATATAGLIVLLTGHTSGSGLLTQAYLEGAGTAAGAASLVGDGLKTLQGAGQLLGLSSMSFSAPFPIYGVGLLVGTPLVEKVPLPVRAIVATPKTFSYLQLLQRGDLPIYLSTLSGPIAPVRVVYTLYQRRSDGTMFQVGPKDRVPTKGTPGEYYATGRAGEFGQPGNWVIRWEFQRTYQSEPQIETMCFRVLDAALAQNPMDATVRVRKYGWN